jgi:hypothetical protein
MRIVERTCECCGEVEGSLFRAGVGVKVSRFGLAAAGMRLGRLSRWGKVVVRACCPDAMMLSSWAGLL